MGGIMDIYALITAGVVVNLIVADSDFIALIQNQYDSCIDVTGIYCGVGFTYDGTNFIAPPKST
jgi:hypothetical protein